MGRRLHLFYQYQYASSVLVQPPSTSTVHLVLNPHHQHYPLCYCKPSRIPDLTTRTQTLSHLNPHWWGPGHWTSHQTPRMNPLWIRNACSCIWEARCTPPILWTWKLPLCLAQRTTCHFYIYLCHWFTYLSCGRKISAFQQHDFTVSCCTTSSNLVNFLWQVFPQDAHHFQFHSFLFSLCACS